jgi:hypothetical protein
MLIIDKLSKDVNKKYIVFYFQFIFLYFYSKTKLILSRFTEQQEINKVL